MHYLLHSTWETSKFSATYNFKFSRVCQRMALHEICENCGEKHSTFWTLSSCSKIASCTEMFYSLERQIFHVLEFHCLDNSMMKQGKVFKENLMSQKEQKGIQQMLCLKNFNWLRMFLL